MGASPQRRSSTLRSCRLLGYPIAFLPWRLRHEALGLIDQFLESCGPPDDAGRHDLPVAADGDRCRNGVDTNRVTDRCPVLLKGSYPRSFRDGGVQCVLGHHDVQAHAGQLRRGLVQLREEVAARLTAAIDEEPLTMLSMWSNPYNAERPVNSSAYRSSAG